MNHRFRSNLCYLRQLILRLSIVVLVFTIIKVLFFLFNTELFPLSTPWQFIEILFYALRFDLSAVIYINTPFILLSLIPFAFRQNANYQKIQQVIFLLFNSVFIIFELIDIGFYQFSFRRTIGSDVGLFENTAGMIPGFLSEYWYLILAFLLLIWCIYFAYAKTTIKHFPAEQSSKLQISIFILSLGLFFVGLRGGFQLRPLMPLTALQYVKDIRLAPLVSNTSLQLIFSTQQDFLSLKNYFPQAEQQAIFNTHRQYHTNTTMDQKNIVLIVLESFGQEHIGHFNPSIEATPFLDSLYQQSFYPSQAYANGLRSTQGIVAITAGIPALMDSPLMFSAYQSNRIDGLAKLLAKEGYATGFFHGANPGSMEFERYAKLSGFQHYYDRIAFDNDEDYDGQWGIWDIPFFQYTAKKVNQYEQPFCALLFSLTSHHPYHTPAWFEKKHPDMEPILRSIRYTDEALRQFFETAQTMPWYENTLFVITADHIGRSKDQRYQTRNGRYKVPILLFDPSQKLVGQQRGLLQHVDLMPTLLDLLKYDQPFKAYGKSMMDTLAESTVFQFNSDIYQLIEGAYLLLYDEQEVIGLYHHLDDPFLQNDLKKDSLSLLNRMEGRLKAVIQQHHEEMIENRLYLE